MLNKTFKVNMLSSLTRNLDACKIKSITAMLFLILQAQAMPTKKSDI